MLTEADALACWFETAPPDSVAGRFRVAARATADGSGAIGPIAGAPTPGPLDMAASADPRVVSLRKWKELGTFLDGYNRGRDPGGTDLDGALRSTRRSLWIGSPCDVCGHTFREGDVVLVRHGTTTQPERVLHHGADLPCSGIQPGPDDPAATDHDRIADRFAVALEPFFPLEPGLVAVRLTDRFFGLAEPHRENRRTCMQCGQTVRIGDRVVRCPCGQPKKACLNVVHHDPARGVACYTTWIHLHNWRKRCGNPLGSQASGLEPP